MGRETWYGEGYAVNRNEWGGAADDGAGDDLKERREGEGERERERKREGIYLPGGGDGLVQCSPIVGGMIHGRGILAGGVGARGEGRTEMFNVTGGQFTS